MIEVILHWLADFEHGLPHWVIHIAICTTICHFIDRKLYHSYGCDKCNKKKGLK